MNIELNYRTINNNLFNYISYIRHVSLTPFPLQTGRWDFNGNGFKGDLNIGSLDGQGNFTGNLVIPNEANTVVIGHYDEISQRIRFQRITHPGDPDPKWIQLYTGYSFTDVVPSGATYYLAGNFVAMASPSQRDTAGWFATFTFPIA